MINEKHHQKEIKIAIETIGQIQIALNAIRLALLCMQTTMPSTKRKLERKARYAVRKS